MCYWSSELAFGGATALIWTTAEAFGGDTMHDVRSVARAALARVARAVDRVLARVAATRRCARRDRERGARAARVRRSRQHALSRHVLRGMDRAARGVRIGRAAAALARRAALARALRRARARRVRARDEQAPAHAAAARARARSYSCSIAAPRAHDAGAPSRSRAARSFGACFQFVQTDARRPDDGHDPAVQPRRRRVHRAAAVRGRSARAARRDRHRSRLRDLFRQARVGVAGSARPHVPRPRQFHARARARRADPASVDRGEARRRKACSALDPWIADNIGHVEGGAVREAAGLDSDASAGCCTRAPAIRSSLLALPLLGARRPAGPARRRAGSAALDATAARRRYDARDARRHAARRRPRRHGQAGSSRDRCGARLARRRAYDARPVRSARSHARSTPPQSPTDPPTSDRDDRFRHCIDLLARLGAELDFDVARQVAVAGGDVDVVWFDRSCRSRRSRRDPLDSAKRRCCRSSRSSRNTADALEAVRSRPRPRTHRGDVARRFAFS